MSGRVDGYASPMRGKSQTCRRGHFFFCGSLTRFLRS